ncbi:MAG: DHH family phosphoesterase [Candidatus Omnitrophica bacterium]|nr:DHH family phosphoesterase [Candidatus Omnitrophota bacterium]MCM8802462.1 DHH family phosphoesterase [Candidatus Omnitrophota bacterium]
MIEIPDFLRQILYKRGIKKESEIKKFLFPNLNDIIEPNRIINIEEASKEILNSIKKGEKIFVYGDGDIDGIGGVFFIIKFLKERNVNFNYYLTHRLDDYEIDENFVNYLLSENYKIIILIDCGISSYKFLKKCSENNIKVIVIDHHQTDIENLPKGHIYIHPFFNSIKSDFSATTLSFKLFQNLMSNYPSLSFKDYISIVGLSILSENLNLTGENRIFAKEMLKDLKYSNIKGLNFLVSKYLNKEFLEIEDVKTKINPKLNSPGRFGKPEITLNLFLEEKEKEIERLLKEIEQLDKKRYELTQKIIKDIEERKEFEFRFLVFENLPESLCGIIASRLTEKFGLPFFIASKKGKILKGSIRAPEDYDLYTKMKKIKDKFLSLGGHKTAIGFKFSAEVEDEIKEYWKSMKIEKKQDDKYFDIVFNIEDIKPEIFEYLNLLKPYGKGNNPPVFLSRNVFLKKIKKGDQEKYWVKKNVIFECEFSNSKKPEEGKKDIFYTPEIKEIDGYYKISLKIKNFQ